MNIPLQFIALSALIVVRGAWGNHAITLVQGLGLAGHRDTFVFFLLTTRKDMLREKTAKRIFYDFLLFLFHFGKVSRMRISTLGGENQTGTHRFHHPVRWLEFGNVFRIVKLYISQAIAR